MSVDQKNTKPKKLLITASIFSILMAVPHFFVPFIFPWEQLVDGLYPPVNWALFAMNIFYSFLLTWGGAVSLVFALKWSIPRSMFNWIYGGIGLFWLIGTIYEIIVPFPIVEARWVLPGIALFIAVLYGASIAKYNK